MKDDDVSMQAATLETGADLSWDRIVEEHSPRVYRLAYRLTGNRQDAEDLTQDVFVRVFRSLDRYEPGNFNGWIHRITTNLFLDRVRRSSKLRMDGFTDGAEDRLEGREQLPEAFVHDAGFDPDIEAALSSLTEEFRVAVVLCDVEGLSYEEIADVLGVKIGTVRSRIHRGRTQLRQALAHRAPTAGRTRVLGALGA
ncbi:RNA polymerase sigma factor SigE [Aeromicrobium sp.]|uniref:RNA polymerase sigma factor SigE n=1 Tax=Aeromicrobium sp. TaxID=1871063 RepID=UPI003517A5FE